MSEVELSYVELTLDMLVEAIPNPELVESLDISGNNISPETCMEFVDRFIVHMPRLRILDMKDNKVGPAGAIHLFETLGKCCPHLTYLDINENAIQDEALYALAVLVKGSHLQTLNIVTNHITPRGLPTLCDGIVANKTLQELSLAFNLLGDEGAKIVANMLSHHPTLVSMDLSDNRISDSGAIALASNLILSRESKVQMINLSVNKIGDVGLGAICEALTKTSNPHLTALDFGCNDLVTDAGRAALVHHALKMKYITSIDLTTCDLSDDDARGLIAAIRSSSSLVSVEWYNNPRMTLPVEKELYEAILAKEVTSGANKRDQTRALVISVGIGAAALAIALAAIRRFRH